MQRRIQVPDTTIKEILLAFTFPRRERRCFNCPRGSPDVFPRFRPAGIASHRQFQPRQASNRSLVERAKGAGRFRLSLREKLGQPPAAPGNPDIYDQRLARLICQMKIDHRRFQSHRDTRVTVRRALIENGRQFARFENEETIQVVHEFRYRFVVAVDAANRASRFILQ